MSPYHLHRLFKATTGMTPKAWQQSWRARRLRDALAKGVPVTQAILNAGFPDSSSYYRKADQTLGMTAKQFRKGGDNVSGTLYPRRLRSGSLSGGRKRAGVSVRSYLVMMTPR